MDGQITILNRQKRRALPANELRAFLQRIITQMEIARSEFSVVFVSDSRIQSLNLKYRGFDKATDVLSFRGEGEYLGDIVISVDTAYNQARRSPTLTYVTNLRRLALHGLLHLLGYDHESDNGEMRTLERRLRRKYRC